MKGIDPNDEGNERLDVGQSATLQPRVYSFKCRGIEFNVIDTPGSASTDGSLQDMINKQAIIRQIEKFTEIHGICIMVDANSSSSADFTPGEAKSTMIDYIKGLNTERNISFEVNKNVFCIDSESFIFQIGWNQSKGFQEARMEKIEIYKESWRESREAVFDLFKKISTMNPCQTEGIISIAKASAAIQCIIFCLSSLVGVINRRTTEYKEETITSLMDGKTIEELVIEAQDQRSFQSIYINENLLEQLIHSRTQIESSNFPSLCHSVPKHFQKIGIDGHNRQCNHYYDHIHNNHKTTNTNSEVDTDLSKSYTREEAEEKYNFFINSLKAEQNAILRHATVLATFLRENAIVEYNTTFEDWINSEIIYKKGNEDYDAINNLKKTLDLYKQKITIINNLSSPNINNIGIADVENSLDKLFNLPIYGEKFKTLYEKEFRTNESANLRDFIPVYVKYIPDIN
ncbi:hypothetical protein FO519_000115 [Halicephalobus sp. NKZ332]|nr:hypothetical protein FO519_000115 [Halicephalobus sp. NKZ332]